MRCHSKSAGILCPSTRPLSAPCVFFLPPPDYILGPLAQLVHRDELDRLGPEPSAVSAAAGRPVPDNPTQEPCHEGEKIVESCAALIYSKRVMIGEAEQ